MSEFSLDHRRRHLRIAAAFLWVMVFCTMVGAQGYVPGVTYFGRSNYIEYIAGELPIIISAPHGGTLRPSEIPDRTNCTSCSGWDFSTATDTSTDDLARKVRTEIQNLTGLVPHIVICRLDRDKIDCNREIVEGAQGDPEAVQAWNEFQNYIIGSRTNVVALHGRGFYIDLHGHGHTIQRLELGYLLTSSQLGLSDGTLNSATYENQSSIRRLSQESILSFPALLRGALSFGALIENEGYPAVPSLSTPNPGSDPYFNGGYNTRQHTSVSLGPMDGLQIESNYTGVRDSSANRTAFTQALAHVLEDLFAMHYHVTLRTSLPKLWLSGSGNWGTAGNWYDGALPVSTNRLLFAGLGGTVTHNLAALSTGQGFVHSITFSNGAIGSYALTGNALSLLAGVTNDSAMPQTVNNNLTLAGKQSFSSSGNLVFGGSITNGGNLLTVTGDGNVTLSGVVSGTGGLTRSGSGTLGLSAVNAYTGTTTNAAGTISFNATSTPGTGTFVWAGGDILSANTRSGAPITNAILMTGDTTIFGNGTLTNSLRVFPFSGNITTSGGTLSIRNAGTNPFASNNVFRVRLTGGAFNFARPIVVGDPNDLPGSISQLESYNCDASGDQVFSGPISGPGQLLRDALCAGAYGKTILTASNSYSGGTLVNGGTLLVNNTTGSATGSGTVTVANGATLGGSGSIGGSVVALGNVSPGESVGTLTIGGGLDLSGGGTFMWELAALTTSGAGTNFDQINLTGGDLVLGGASKLQLNFIDVASAPSESDPFWLTSHEWKIISFAAAATNMGSGFSTILNANFATGGFTNYVDSGGGILLAYNARPAVPPGIRSVAMTAGDEFLLSFNTETNRTYVLQLATNLNAPDWINISTNIASSDLLTLTNFTGGDPARFYRVLVLP